MCVDDGNCGLDQECGMSSAHSLVVVLNTWVGLGRARLGLMQHTSACPNSDKSTLARPRSVVCV